MTWIDTIDPKSFESLFNQQRNDQEIEMKSNIKKSNSLYFQFSTAQSLKPLICSEAVSLKRFNSLQEQEGNDQGKLNLIQTHSIIFDSVLIQNLPQ